MVGKNLFVTFIGIGIDLKTYFLHLGVPLNSDIVDQGCREANKVEKHGSRALKRLIFVLLAEVWNDSKILEAQ